MSDDGVPFFIWMGAFALLVMIVSTSMRGCDTTFGGDDPPPGITDEYEEYAPVQEQEPEPVPERDEDMEMLPEVVVLGMPDKEHIESTACKQYADNDVRCTVTYGEGYDPMIGDNVQVVYMDPTHEHVANAKLATEFLGFTGTLEKPMKFIIICSIIFVTMMFFGRSIRRWLYW